MMVCAILQAHDRQWFYSSLDVWVRVGFDFDRTFTMKENGEFSTKLLSREVNRMTDKILKTTVMVHAPQRPYNKQKYDAGMWLGRKNLAQHFVRTE
jgi:hypothetical protein